MANGAHESRELAERWKGIIGKIWYLRVFRGRREVSSGKQEADALNESIYRGEDGMKGGFGNCAPQEDDHDAWKHVSYSLGILCVAATYRGPHGSQF
jgi:hypothetical protein